MYGSHLDNLNPTDEAILEASHDDPELYDALEDDGPYDRWLAEMSGFDVSVELGVRA